MMAAVKQPPSSHYPWTADSVTSDSYQLVVHSMCEELVRIDKGPSIHKPWLSGEEESNLCNFTQNFQEIYWAS